MCGKYERLMQLPINSPGSPPRVREVFDLLTRFTTILGITPACAGSIKVVGEWIDNHEDHPRVCGKYQINCCKLRTVRGSPPRVREVYVMHNVSFFKLGITPACAGSILKKVNIYAISSIAFSKILLLSLLACSVHSNMLVLFYPLYIQSHIL